MADNGHGAGESRPSEMHPQPILEGRELTWEGIVEGLGTMMRFIVGTQDVSVNLSRENRVPRFWANSDDEDASIADIIVFGVGVFFGAIHCIAWSFSFPTHAELLIWRISSVAITVVPTYIIVMLLLGSWLHDMDFNATVDVADLSILLTGILYIIARVVTLVLAFTSLKDLAPGAFDTVHWTTFIPHI